MTQSSDTPRDDALPPPPPAWSAAEPTPPPPPAWSAPDAPGAPAWAPPAPLSFGPPEPPPGPLVSPSVAAYQPPPPAAPSSEPATGAMPVPPLSPPPPAPYPAPAPLTYYPAPDASPASSGSVTGYPAPPPYPPPPAPGHPTTGQPAYYPPAGYGGYAPGYPGASPMPYGFDPMTGQQYSDKSKTTAGLLQLLLSLLLTLGGIGRLYAGHSGIGVTQLVLSVGSWIVICAAGRGGIVFGLLMLTIVWFWSWIDGVVILSGRPVDAQGRLLRP